MGLLKKGKKKKPLRMAGHGASSGKTSNARPQQNLKTAPCAATCPSGNSIRMWFQAIAQREKLGMNEEEAFTKAWNIIVETNPFPSVMGRVCPHPCEDQCNREGKAILHSRHDLTSSSLAGVSEQATLDYETSPQEVRLSSPKAWRALPWRAVR